MGRAPGLLYDDDELAVINKPSQFMVCDDKPFDGMHKHVYRPKSDRERRDGPHGCLARFALSKFGEKFPDLCKVHKLSTGNFGALNRLDKDTSGVICIWKNNEVK